MGMRAYTPSPKNLDGAYSSAVRMGKSTKYAPVKMSRQFVPTAAPAAIASPVKVK